MSSWTVLVLCALALSASAFSPVPEMDIVSEDVDMWNVMTRDVAYRLPNTTAPRHYTITLIPYFEHNDSSLAFTFDGRVIVYVSVLEPNIREIVMHCNDLTINTISVTTSSSGVASFAPFDGVIPTCDPVYDFLRVGFTEDLVVGQEYVLSMSYRGNLQTDMRGFYRSWYYDSTGIKRWMGTTQFQPGHARKAFPCYDEPGFKATFGITIIREAGFSPTISNMPILSNSTYSEDRISETFYTTPVMSTYLIAFIVSHYQVAHSTPEDDPRPFQVIARDNIGNTGEWAFQTGVAILEYMEQYTNISYYEMANNMDMKQVAIPDFSAGAMENWGLLTYREALILYDPDNSNHFYRQRIPNIVAHEVAHMWFGNLVTCAWWDVLWLNEGFARFYQYFLTGAVRPELGFETRFIVEQVQASLLVDSVDTAHALNNPNVNTPTEVSNMFSTITYAKGASVIRMTQHFLGDDTFVKALRTYLKDREYNVASPEHLFEALEAAAAEDQAIASYPGITVTEYYKTWVEQGGHPILTVAVNHETGVITVTQARWEITTGVSANSGIWQIPITWTRQNAQDFVNTKPSQVLTNQVTVLNRGSTGYEWVLFNIQQTGFYRVNYDPTTWSLITLALRSDERNSIHEYNRAQIVDDVFVLARAGVLSYTQALNILSFLEFETEYTPWIAAITGFNWLRRRLAHDDAALAELDSIIIQLSTAVVQRLGFSELPTDTYLDGLLRMYLLTFLCNVGHAQCTAAAAANFAALRAEPSVHLPGNLRPWVYCSGLRQGTADDFNFLWNRYVNEDLAGEKVVLLESLGCTSDVASLNFYLSETYSGSDNIREQDLTTALYYAVVGNEANTWTSFQWLQSNYQAVIDEAGSLATPLGYIAPRLLTEQQIQQFESWLNANPTLPGVATGLAGVTTVRNNLAWSSNRLPELTEYFENGYQEIEQTEDTTPTPEQVDPEEEEEGEVEEIEEVEEVEEGDSGESGADVASLGAFTLIFSVVASFIVTLNRQ